MEIPVRIVAHRPIATVTLNGVEVPMLVDSGAFYSMLSASTATQLQLPLRSLPFGTRIEGYTGRVEVRRTRVEKMGLRDAEWPNVEFLVGGNELGAGIMGILGRNILDLGDTEYDLAHGAVRLHFPKGDCSETNFAYWAGEAPIIAAELDRRIGSRDTAIRLMVNINGKSTLALLDTGAPSSALTLRAAHRAGIEARDLVPAGRTGGAGEGKVKSWIGPMKLFELAGEKISNNRISVNDTDRPDEGMVIGLDYFLSHRIYVSRGQQRAYITWNGGGVFALQQAEPGTYDTRYAAVPEAVAADNADALARRGAASLAAGNHARALEDLNRACELAPGVASFFYDRARVHGAMRQGRLALMDLEQALRIDPSMAEARMQRARLRAALGHRTEAKEDLVQLDAALAPAAPLRITMARVWALMDDAPAALRQFDLWISSHDRDAQLATALNDRCWLRARLNIDLPLALQDCKAAVDKDSGEAAFADSLGWTYLRMGDTAKALRAFDDAIAIQALPMSLYGRGLVKLRRQDSEGAQADLGRARQMRPRIDDELRRQGFGFADGSDVPPASGS